MSIYDGNADVVVVKLIGALTAVSIAILGVWHRFYRTRRAVSGENGERQRFEDAINDAREARREAHDANNRVMDVQRTLGRLEAENEECNRRADRQDEQIDELKTQNSQQARQIAALMRNRGGGPFTDTEIGVRHGD